jgi:hypothetical protein
MRLARLFVVLAPKAKISPKSFGAKAATFSFGAARSFYVKTYQDARRRTYVIFWYKKVNRVEQDSSCQNANSDADDHECLAEPSFISKANVLHKQTLSSFTAVDKNNHHKTQAHTF